MSLSTGISTILTIGRSSVLGTGRLGSFVRGSKAGIEASSSFSSSFSFSFFSRSSFSCLGFEFGFISGFGFPPLSRAFSSLSRPISSLA
ncbi:hypothetical protein ES705_48432 [subsurface metagenome]